MRAICVFQIFLDIGPEIGILGPMAQERGQGRIVAGGQRMLQNILDAIRSGDWLFEPQEVGASDFQATSAMPGSKEKLDVLASRVRSGLPLWHESDRCDYEEPKD